MEEVPEKIYFKDCLLFLIGDEKAIRKLARWDKSILFGGFFVLIAGICREYDQEYFPLNGAIYFFPFVASFFMCLFLRVICQVYYSKKKNPAGLGSFKTFLALFWLTAPCAWLYAIPVEKFFDS